MAKINRALKKVIALSFSIFCLASCVLNLHINRRVNYIVPGEFYGDEMRDESILCKLIIEPITEEEYKEANGLNVVQDVIREGYYSLLFTATYESGETKSFDFINLKDDNPGVPACPALYKGYKGDIESTFMPEMGHNGIPRYEVDFFNKESNELILVSTLYSEKDE